MSKSPSKKELLEMIALMQKAPDVSPPSAKLAISAEAQSALIDSFVSTNDDQSRNVTFRDGVLAFGRSIPAEYFGKVLPKEIVDSMAERAAAKLQASFGPWDAMDEKRQKTVKFLVSQKKSRAKQAFACAPILAVAYSQGFTGTIQHTLKLCTKLQDNAYDLPKALAMLEVKPAIDRAADVVRHVAAILSITDAPDLRAVNARAKAQMVAWCDEHGVIVKGAEEYRNPALART